MAVNVLHCIEYRAAEILQATLVTTLFGFIGWLGATSFVWGFGFAVLGGAIDLARWRYRYDWDSRKFVDNSWRGRGFLIALQQNGNTEPFKRVARTERLFNTAFFLSWFCVFMLVLLVNAVFSDGPFCSNAAFVDAFSFPAFHLVGAIRIISDQLNSHGYECRAVYVMFYYSLVFYLFSISIAAFAIFYSHNSGIYSSVKELFDEGVLNVGRAAGAIRRPLVLLLFVLAMITILFLFRDVEFERRGGMVWNIHDSNVQLFMFAIFMCALCIVVRVIFYTSRYTALKYFAFGK